MEERVEVAKRHLEMSVAWKGPVLGVLETRRHYTNYFKGYHNFKSFRKRMVTSNSAEEVYKVLNEVLEVYDLELGSLLNSYNFFEIPFVAQNVLNVPRVIKVIITTKIFLNSKRTG